MMTSLEQLVDPEAFCRIIDAYVEALDLEAFGFKHVALNKEGRPPYHPADMLKLYVYGHQAGIRSCRKLEQACKVNVEVMWLLEGRQPHYRTIAQFKKDHPKSFELVFENFVKLLKSWKLVDGKTIAVDSFKIRGQNSLKNNFNEGKLLRHLDYIDGKLEHYLAKNEQTNSSLLAEKIEHQVDKYNQYAETLEELRQSPEDQISTTDRDARAVILHRNIVNVGYNIQAVTDSKSKLLVALDTGTVNDTHALSPMVKTAMKNLDISRTSVIADKGYHTGAQLATCEELKATTFVSPKANAANVRHQVFPMEMFKYHPGSDTFRCPNNEILRSNGTWYQRKGTSKKSTPVPFKHYKTKACKTCPLKAQCTSSPRARVIYRTKYQSAVDRNNKRVNLAPEYYRKRQQIIEHQFGTFKRQWGYTYTLVRGIQNVKGEVALLFTAYNLRRSMSILGFSELLKRLKALFSTFFMIFSVAPPLEAVKIKSWCLGLGSSRI